jgi:hypothetical protein
MGKPVDHHPTFPAPPEHAALSRQHDVHGEPLVTPAGQASGSRATTRLADDSPYLGRRHTDIPEELVRHRAFLLDPARQ